MKSSKFGKVFFAILMACLFATVGGYAQTGTASVVGTITDPQGRPVAGEKVTLTNVATNATRSSSKFSKDIDFSFREYPDFGSFVCSLLG